MAVLLNETSNLRLRVELVQRLSDGAVRPASLEMLFAVERYKPITSGLGGEHRFVPMISIAGKPLLDLDLIQFFEAADALLQNLEGAPPLASLEASVEPSLALRIARGGPGSFLIEVGIDLHALLEPIGEVRSEPGADLAMFRFPATNRGVVTFFQALLAEFARFPTDPSKVLAGRPD